MLVPSFYQAQIISGNIASKFGIFLIGGRTSARSRSVTLWTSFLKNRKRQQSVGRFGRLPGRLVVGMGVVVAHVLRMTPQAAGLRNPTTIRF